MGKLTKLQVKVDELAKSLPTSTLIYKRIKSSLFEKVGYNTGKKVLCMECGQSFECSCSKTKIRCKCCGEVIKVENSRKITRVDEGNYLYSLAYKGFQVNRFFYVKKCCRKGMEPYYFIDEVLQRWVASNGRLVTRAKSFKPFAYSNLWNFNSDMTIKRTNTNPDFWIADRWDICYHSYHTDSIIPELVRNGYDGNDHDVLSLVNLQMGLLNNNHFETIWKCGFFEFVKLSKEKLEDLWEQVKICIRHQYHVDDVTIWCDMIKDIEELGKDIHNPKLICPENLSMAHDYWLEKVRQKKIKEKREKEIENIKNEENEYHTRMGAYLDIVIDDDQYIITPLQSVMDFFDEGEAMHHCVYHNQYYKKDKCLVLSVRNRLNKRVSTIEFDLKKMKILQNRAACNGVPQDKDIIEDLFMQNINKIAQAKRLASKKKRGIKTAA